MSSLFGTSWGIKKNRRLIENQVGTSVVQFLTFSNVNVISITSHVLFLSFHFSCFLTCIFPLFRLLSCCLLLSYVSIFQQRRKKYKKTNKERKTARKERKKEAKKETNNQRQKIRPKERESTRVVKKG